VDVKCNGGGSSSTVQKNADKFELKSSNYPNDYNEFSECNYRFQASADEELKLSCASMSLGRHSEFGFTQAAEPGKQKRYSCKEEREPSCSLPGFKADLGVSVADVSFTSCIEAAAGYNCSLWAEKQKNTTTVDPDEKRTYNYTEDGCRSPAGDSQLADWVVELVRIIYSAPSGYLPSNLYSPWNIPDQRFNVNGDSSSVSLNTSAVTLTGLTTPPSFCWLNMSTSNTSYRTGWRLKLGDWSAKGNFDLEGSQSSLFGQIKVKDSGKFSYEIKGLEQLATIGIGKDPTNSSRYRITDLEIDFTNTDQTLSFDCAGCNPVTTVLLNQLGDKFVNVMWGVGRQLNPVVTENVKVLVNKYILEEI